MRIGLLSFAAPPASGGGSVYVQLLSDAIAASTGHELHVFSERLAAGQVEPNLGPQTRIHRVFSPRATLQERTARSFSNYGFQQVQTAVLARSIARLALDALLIHAAVFRYPNAMPLLVRSARRSGVATVLDVRDVAFPESQKKHLAQFDLILACAEASRQHIELVSGGEIDAPVVPVIFEWKPPNDAERAEADTVLHTLGLGPKDPFVMMNGGLTPAKGAAKAAAVALELRKSGLPMVSCGPDRLTDPLIEEARAAEALRFAGRVPHGVHTAILERSKCIASFSVQEGLPRTFLEAIAMGKCLFAPSVVPEFDHLPQLRGNPNEMAQQIVEAVQRGDYVKPSEYDLSQHAPAAVLEKLIGHLQRL